MADLDLPYGTNLFIRARAYYPGGHPGSWSLMEFTRNIYLEPQLAYIYLPLILK
ncbi:MAG: hypothetical protein AAGU04_08555 [Anaerolineaceae bacterium]